jgi:hypothetical protein
MEQKGQRGRGPRIRYPQSDDSARRKEVRALSPDRIPPKQEETSQERKKAKREPGKPLPSCLQRSGKGPLKVKFKEVRIPDSDDEAVIGWAEDEYVLPLEGNLVSLNSRRT